MNSPPDTYLSNSSAIHFPLSSARLARTVALYPRVLNPGGINLKYTQDFQDFATFVFYLPSRQ